MTWWRRTGRERDLDSEIRADLEFEAEEQGKNGLSAEEAYYAARRAFGNVTWVKEEARFMWGWTLWETMLGEIVSGSVAYQSEAKYTEIEHPSTAGDKLVFEVHDNPNRVVTFRLALRGNGTTGRSPRRSGQTRNSLAPGNYCFS